MRKVLVAATAALFIAVAFAAPAGANDDSGGRTPIPTTTVAPTTTTVAPAPTTTVAPAPTPTTAPPAPAPGPVETPTPRRSPAPTTAPTTVPPVPTTAPAPTTTTTVPPAQPEITAGVDCVQGLVIGATNTGGEAANLTIVIDGNVVHDLVVQPGGTETYVFDLNPADAGTTKVVQVFHGDVAIYDTPLTVECGNFAATPCEAVTAAGTPAITEAPGTGCTNPCWWAPAAVALGVLIGRRRRNGKYNPAGIAAGIAGVFFALMGAGAAPLAWAGLAALAIAGAVMLARRNHDVTDAEDADAPEATDEETPATAEDTESPNNTAEEAKAETA